MIPLYGFAVSGRVAFELDGLFSGRLKNYGNWLVYSKLSQVFVGSVPTVMGGGGLEIRPYKNAYVEFGGLYMLSKQIKATSVSGYADTISVGGLGYNISFGIRY